MDDATKKQLVARITLCAEILAEQKSMLTLEQEEYALLVDEEWGAFNPAVVVAADANFQRQVEWVERVMHKDIAALALNAITCSFPDYVPPEERPELPSTSEA